MKSWKFTTGQMGSLVIWILFSSLLFLSLSPLFGCLLSWKEHLRRHQRSVAYVPPGPSDHLLLPIHPVLWNRTAIILCSGILFLCISFLLKLSSTTLLNHNTFFTQKPTSSISSFRIKISTLIWELNILDFQIRWLRCIISHRCSVFVFIHVYSATDFYFSSIHFFFLIPAAI